MPSYPGYNPPPPGAELKRGWLGELWRGVLARTRIVAGPGLQAREIPGGGGHIVSLDTDRELWIAARVTAAPAFAPTAPASCLYAVQAHARPGLTLTGVPPALGRPTQQDEWMLWPARVGDPCFIVRAWDAAESKFTDRLWIQTEAIAAKPC